MVQWWGVVDIYIGTDYCLVEMYIQVFFTSECEGSLGAFVRNYALRDKVRIRKTLL